MKNRPLWSDKDGVVIGYMDKISYDYEIGCALGGATVYATIDDYLRRHHGGKCKTCGIVQIEIRLKKVITETLTPKVRFKKVVKEVLTPKDNKFIAKTIREDTKRLQRLKKLNFTPMKKPKPSSINKEVNDVPNSDPRRRKPRRRRATEISIKRKR